MLLTPLLGTSIFPGGFVIVCDGNRFEGCQVSRSISEEAAEVVRWVEPVDAPPICPRTFDNAIHSKVKELVAGSSTIISVQDVIDVAFIFTPQLLQSFWTDVVGMTRVYFTRSPSTLPFSVSVVQSYPCHIWFSLFNVKEIVQRVMSSK